MDFDYNRRELEREWESVHCHRRLIEASDEFQNMLGDTMTFYVEFEDGEEFVVCCDDEQEARENTIDMQKMFGRSTVITACREVAER